MVISQVLSSPAATAVAAAPDFHVAALQRRGKANFFYSFPLSFHKDDRFGIVLHRVELIA